MFTTVAFALMAVLLTLGVITDSFWGYFQRRRGFRAVRLRKTFDADDRDQRADAAS